MPSAVAASNRSVEYSSVPASPSGRSARVASKSYFAVPVSMSSGSTRRWRLDSVTNGVFCSTNFTWNSGIRPGSRGGFSARTNVSNGTS